jgi:hypothetical protein
MLYGAFKAYGILFHIVDALEELVIVFVINLFFIVNWDDLLGCLTIPLDLRVLSTVLLAV